MTTLSFNVSREDHDTIAKITERAFALALAHNSTPPSRTDWLMDITATHASGCPLKLEALLKADDFNFAHDVFGIRRHLDRTTGQLTDCFVPRYAV